MPNTRNTMLAAVLTGSALFAAGCSPAQSVDGRSDTPSPRVEIADYALAFDATRETLADYRFTLERVDAVRGVITTAPKRTAGLATPWDREQSSLGGEWQDLVHQHERVCRVTFVPEGAPTHAVVEVVIHRVRRPGWRVETDAIGRSSHARNPEARAARREPEFREPIALDRALAERLAREIASRSILPTQASADAAIKSD